MKCLKLALNFYFISFCDWLRLKRRQDKSRWILSTSKRNVITPELLLAPFYKYYESKGLKKLVTEETFL